MTISICLTDLGDLTLSSNVNIYSNSDNFTTPIYTNVPVSSLFPPNCSFTATVPSGTTIIQINDPISGCITYINVLCSDFCDCCNLRFDVFSSNTISQIVAGNLISDCTENIITDYIIDWYGPNSTTNVAYTSGFGTEFTGYNYTHPLTGSSVVYSQPGVYYPQIRFIKINGIIFSQDGNSGSVISDINSCITGNTSSVSAFTCSNGGQSSVSAYTHEINVTTQSNTPPIPYQMSVILSSTTKYFAWAFNGEEFPDTLKLTFSGSSYSDPIVFENITLGFASLMNNTGMTFNPSTIVKSGKTSGNIFVKKVNVLSGLTINDGDLIFIDVIPSQVINETKWSLFFNPCLTTFNCANCIVDTPVPYKVLGSTINATQVFCGAKIEWDYSGCSETDIFNSNLYTYVGMGSYVLDPITNSQQILDQTTTKFTFPLSRNKHLLSQGNWTDDTYLGGASNCVLCQGTQNPNVCTENGFGTIRYEKSNTGVGGTGIFKMTFSDINDFNYYRNEIISIANSVITPGGLGSCSSNFYFIDNTQPKYYRHFTIYVPRNVDDNSANCGPNMEQLIYHFHPTTVLTTGTTGGQYTIQLTMPTIANNLNAGTCTNCTPNLLQILNNINNSSTGTTNSVGKIIDIITTKSCRYQYPTNKLLLGNIQTFSQINKYGYDYFALPKYLNETYMYSGSPLTLIPSLSAETCDFTGKLGYGTNFPSSANIAKNGGSYIKQTSATAVITDWNNGPGWENYKLQTKLTYNDFNWFDIYVVDNGIVTYIDTNYII